LTAKKKTLFLVDGHALVYRSFFAFIRNPLINKKGENTSATFGFVNSLLKILKEEKPDYFAVVFDTPEPTFRHEKYADYKSTRAKMPDELVDQLPRIRQATEALRITTLELPGYEADDIIGTLAKRAAKDGLEVWCVTGDKDFFQLVNNGIGIYYPGRDSGTYIKMGREEVKGKFGVYPELVIDKLALMGDTSDNVPGIPGVGPKTADSLLEEFGSVDKVLESVKKIKAKGLQEKIEQNSQSAIISRELVTIHTDTPVKTKLEDLKVQEPDYEACKRLFLELQFNRLLKEFLPPSMAVDDSDSEKSASKADYRQIKNIDEVKKLCAELAKKKEVAVDTETTSLNSLEAELVGISLSAEAGKAYYIPVRHDDKKSNLPLDQTLSEIKKLLLNDKVQKFGQNIKYDLEVFHRYDIDIEPISFDTMLASYVIDPTSREHSLDYQAMKHFNYKMQPITDLIGTGKNQKNFATVSVKDATFYAAEDADYTYRLRGALAPQIHKNQLDDLYYNIELPLVKVLAAVEEAGIKVNADFLEALSKKTENSLVDITKNIYKIAGGEFNINSTQQLSHVLFEKLKLPTKGKTAKKTGFSTDVKVLEELAAIHELPKLILDYRQLNKLKNTYIDAIPALISKHTGRVHTTFNQTIAATGRLSSVDPNLQNIPVRTEEGREIRKAFIPGSKDYQLLVADYSQIELRILAHYSEDKTLIKAFKDGEDIHARTAAEVFGVDMKKVTPDQRRAAKTANFAVIYGVSAYGLSQQSELNVEQSKTFIDNYFKRYPGVKKYMDSTIEFARKNGYVTTLFNRRRYIREINDQNRTVRQFAERTAINTPVQGTAADMIKLAMIRIHKNMHGLKSKMVLQVHDELIFDVHNPELDKVKKIVKDGMENAVKLKVPVVVDMGVGSSWFDAKA
jgi:DNA polymerase-1